MAAKGAANRLKIYKPRSKMGFLRQKSDGSTSLKFLTGNSGIVPGSENSERPVTLGALIGKVKQGNSNHYKELYCNFFIRIEVILRLILMIFSPDLKTR